MKNVSIGIGIVLGMLTVSAAIYLINIFLYKGNNIDKALPEYIKNSTVYEVTVPESDRKHQPKLLDIDFKTYKKNIKSDKNGNVTKITFYCEQRHKYFSILLYDIGNQSGGLIYLNIGNQKTAITVNNDDLNNSLYGNTDNPIPVFKFNIISPQHDNPILHTTQQDYIYNVTQYLKYVIPKEEFEKRFGKA